MKSKFIIVLMCLLCVISFANVFVYADSEFGTGYDPSVIPSENDDIHNNIKKPINKIWNTVIIIIQILSVAGIVATGLRYMLESADKKASLKQGLVPLTIGCILVFSASTVAGFVVASFNEAVGMETDAQIFNKNKAYISNLRDEVNRLNIDNGDRATIISMINMLDKAYTKEEQNDKYQANIDAIKTMIDKAVQNNKENVVNSVVAKFNKMKEQLNAYISSHPGEAAQISMIINEIGTASGNYQSTQDIKYFNDVWAKYNGKYGISVPN